MKFEEMKSRVPNLKRIENKVNALIEGLNNAQDAKEAIKIVKKYFKIQDEYTSDSTIAWMHANMFDLHIYFALRRNSANKGFGLWIPMARQKFNRRVNGGLIYV